MKYKYLSIFLFSFIFSSCLWLLDRPVQKPEETPVPTFSPTKTETPIEKEIIKSVFEDVLVGRYHDYSIDQITGKGYVLALINQTFRVSEFDGRTLSLPETATNQGPNHRLLFNRPRIISNNDIVYIFWGPESKRDTGIKYIFKENGKWSEIRKIFSSRYIEFFDVEFSNGKVIGHFFALPNDETNNGDFIFFNLDEDVLKNIKFNAKGFNSLKTEKKTYYSTRFINNTLWSVEENNIYRNNYSKPEIHEPIIQTSDVENPSVWLHGYVFNGEEPDYLALDNGTKVLNLLKLNSLQKHSTSLLTASFSIFDKIYIFYDLDETVFQGELKTFENVKLHNVSFIRRGYYPVAQSWKNKRGEVVFRNSSDKNSRFGTLISYEYR